MRAIRRKSFAERAAAAAAVLLLCLFMAFQPAQAAQGSGKGSISIASSSDQSVDASFTLYKVADWAKDGQSFTLDPALASGNQDIDLTDISSRQQALADTLDSLVRSAGSSLKPVVSGKAIKVSGGAGALLADGLDQGLYILEGTSGKLVMNPVLITLPDKNGEDITIEATKFSAPESLSKIRIVKLWKDTNAKTRPKSVTVRVTYKDGTYKDVTLNDANKWTVTLSAADFGVTGISPLSDWSVAEKSGASGYNVSITALTAADEDQTASWIVTNTGKTVKPGKPTTPSTPSKRAKAVKTGDPSNISLWILILAVSGMAMALLGWRLSRRGRREQAS